ncbi:hypothetical protein NQ314_014358 [Rhamnusium bicolor]|uniref:Uncharacterized protein n=1 Tax=Rhamnusium bicolor TaxID=1586634 RepID=A0AAV8X2K0_9CUCU|nr:hypothetical protein NQ314_014358 [Rhamnusium bicolor]
MAIIQVATTEQKIRFGEPWLPGNWEYNENSTKADQGPHCFPYWISSIKGNLILNSRCFAIQPTWMSDNRYRIKVFIIKIRIYMFMYCLILLSFYYNYNE